MDNPIVRAEEQRLSAGGDACDGGKARRGGGAQQSSDEKKKTSSLTGRYAVPDHFEEWWEKYEKGTDQELSLVNAGGFHRMGKGSPRRKKGVALGTNPFDQSNTCAEKPKEKEAREG